MGIDFSKGPIRGRGFIVPATDEHLARAARLIAAEAKRATPVLAVTPAEMAEHLRSCTCHTHLNDLDEGDD